MREGNHDSRRQTVTELLAPRLSSHLRNQQGRHFELDAAQLERRRLLAQQQQQLAQAAQPSVLNWREFAAGLDTSDGVAAKAARNTLTDFVRLAADVAQGGAFAEADRTLFAALTAGDGAARQARRELEAAVGHVDAAKWKRLVAAARELQAWRAARQREKAAASGGAAATAAEPQPQEWGLDLDIDVTPREPPRDDAALIARLDALLASAGDEPPPPAAAAAPPPPPPEPQPARAAAPSAGGATATWLLERCAAHAALGLSALPPRDLALSILGAVHAASGDADALQGPLFDLLGEAGLELVMEVLERAAALAGVDAPELEAAAAGRRGGGGAAVPAAARRAAPPPQARAGPTVGAQITIKTTSEIEAEKQWRKEQKRQGKAAAAAAAAGAPAGVPDWLQAVGFDEQYLAQERALGLQGGALPPGYRYDPELGVLAPEGTREYHEQRGGLPADATKTVVPGEYEEVHIPARKRSSAQLDASRLVPVAALEPWAQTAFQGTKRLNPMQSQVFEVAYNSAQNMLVCAPTGAGKTNVAMLALLQLVKRHMHNGRVDRHGLKAVYVAPMKALAQEVVAKFSQRLKPLGLVVKEYTGDMQLTRAEVEDANVVVTTPEKWDVVTRKGGDGALVSSVGLLLIDEVHLLADDRGAVIESVVARTRRMVESSQRFVRIVGLSATLPNYKDVAAFLQVRVGDGGGLFYFGPEHRPVPLDQTFIGVVEKQRMRQIAKLNAIAFERAAQSVRVGHQVMVFVHARKDTVRTAQALLELAAREGNPDEFAMEGADARAKHEAAVLKSRNRELRQLFASGVGCHHAGMLRSDRGLTERAFEDGGLRLLVCTATLAWGVNLPAHTVIIKGTEVYNPEKGGAEDLSILDVLQIFGRAGRPQYDTSGEAILITTHKSLDRYLALLARATPIESNFIKALEDHLNAEVAAGTVTNVREAVMWLSYTYLYVRMQKNPMAYGIKLADAEADPRAEQRRNKLILDAAAVLDDRRMIRYDPQSGNLASTDLGRAASHFYIQHESVFRFNKGMKQQMNDAAVVALVCLASEFDQIRVRPEELKDLDDMRASCPLDIKAPLDDSAGKVNVLLQSHISNQRSANFTLVSDGNYIAQNAGRVSRALFEIALRKGWSSLARRLLELSKAIDRRTWWTKTPLRQFGGDLPFSVLEALDGTRLEALLEMGANEVGDLCRVHRLGEKVLHLAQRLPRVSVRAAVQPVTRGVLRVTLTVAAAFEWHDRMHGTSEPWWIWVEDADCERIYHSEHFVLPKRGRHDEHVLAFTIPIFEPKPPQYWVRAISDRWLGCETVVPISFKHLLLPEQHPSHTSLLDLAPLPVAALQDPAFAAVFRGYTHFNPIQTQLFHVLYHTDASILLGAPTGSGKTAVAEIAVLRMLRQSRQSRAEGGTGCAAVYIAPLKALARERIRDWRRKFGGSGGGGLGLSVLELTGDAAPDAAALRRADIIVTTPEKWDGVTRGWKARPYVSRATLLIMDEVHLLGEERGPVLEVIVSRMRHIAAQTGRPVRFVGLSTALANARDLADWLGVDSSGVGLYNFRPSVRPIPCEVHIQGYPGKHYCPRMATMNKPTYAAIMEHSPDKPVLVFVASRRQTRLTALDLISLCAGGDTPKQFLHMPEEEAAAAADAARDPALRHTLPFGIGIHHAGLDEADRSVVEELFGAGKLQVLVCTSTLAWGVNFPAHLVVVKGTEYFDGRLGRYVDFPVTDVLQMIGRAGRPQFDTHAVAVILVHEPKKNFLKKFLYEPFPVESQLAGALPNHVNAEIAGGAIGSREDALAYMTWTYLFRRIVQNPSYYQLEDTTPEGVTAYLQGLVDDALAALDESGCIETSEDGERVKSTPLGRIASYYYLDHATVGEACDTLETLADDGDGDDDSDSAELCRILADAREFAELPVRHNEDVLNAELAAELPWAVDAARVGEANTKAYLLLQAHMCRAPLPISDYANDTKSVLDQAPRVLNALVDTAALLGLLSPTLRLMRLSQCLLAAILPGADPLLQLPGVAGAAAAARVRAAAARAGAAAAAAAAAVVSGGGGLRPLLRLAESDARRVLTAGMRDGAGATAAAAAAAALARLPLLEIRAELTGNVGSSSSGGAGERPVLLEGEEYEMTVRLEVAPGTGLGGSSGGVWQQQQQQQQSRKGRELGWWLVLGSDADGELLAMKKVGRIARGRPVETRLKFQPPAAAGGGGDAAMTLYAVADAAAGIDAQVALPLRVVAAASAGAADGAAAAGSEWPAMVAKPPAGGAAEQRSDGGGGSGSAAADGDGGANGADGEGTSSVAGQDFWG